MLVMEEFKDDFLAPFKSQGVLEIDDVGMVIRGKFMCKPGTQFMIRKEIFNRVNAAFAEQGLEFARREVRVALPSMEGLWRAERRGQGRNLGCGHASGPGTGC